MVHILFKRLSTIHLDDDHIKADADICLCRQVSVTIPWSSSPSGTEWFFILLWLTSRHFCLGCFKVKVFSNMTQELIPASDKTKHLNPFRCYQYHNKHSGLSHTVMPFFLWKATFTLQHVTTTDKRCSNLTGAQSSIPFCFSTVLNTISTYMKFFLFPTTLKQ